MNVDGIGETPPPPPMVGGQYFASFDVTAYGYYPRRQGGTMPPGPPALQPGENLFLMVCSYGGGEAVGVHSHTGLRIGKLKTRASENLIHLLDLRQEWEEDGVHREEPIFFFIGRVIRFDARGHPGAVQVKVFVYTSPGVEQDNARSELSAAFGAVVFRN